jgi:hypothetical protein
LRLLIGLIAEWRSFYVTDLRQYSMRIIPQRSPQI